MLLASGFLMTLPGMGIWATVMQWNALVIRNKKLDQQQYLKTNGMYVCRVQPPPPNQKTNKKQQLILLQIIASQ